MTIDEVYKSFPHNSEGYISEGNAKAMAEVIARFHVKKALKAAEKADFIDAEGVSISPKSNNLHWTACGSIGDIVYKPNIILNAYNLDNIK